MLKLSRKYKGKKPAKNNIIQDKMAQKIVTCCILWQSEWAAWMQSRSERISGKAKLFLLFVFIGLTGGYNLYLITESSLIKKASTFPKSSIKKPSQLQEQGDKIMQKQGFISPEEFQKIHGFKLFMDSLEHSPSEKALYDSIISARPGLMDSIIIIENIYQSQTQK